MSQGIILFTMLCTVQSNEKREDEMLEQWYILDSASNQSAIVKRTYRYREVQDISQEGKKKEVAFQRC